MANSKRTITSEDRNPPRSQTKTSRFLTRQLLSKAFLWIVILIITPLALSQSSSGYDPLSNTITTPLPINPAANTTNPGAAAAQQQNPFLGSVQQCRVNGANLEISLNDAIQCGLRFNLGFIDSREGSATARAERIRALSILLPQIAANAREEYVKYSAIPTGAEKIHFSIPAVGETIQFPLSVGPFNYQYSGLSMSEDLFDEHSRLLMKAAGQDYKASIAALADARDVVVLAAGGTYLQVVTSKSRLQAAVAQRDAMKVFDDFTEQRVREKV